MTRFPGFVLAVSLAAAAAPVGAQPSFHVTFGPALESLQAADQERESQGNLAGAGGVEYLFADERARVFYDLGVNDYATAGDWRTLVQEFGGRYRFDLGDNDQHHLFAGSSVALRRNGESWNAADYNALGAFVNLELHPSATAALRTGYRVDVRRFPTYEPLDQAEQKAFASGLVNLQTRTTLIGEIVFGAKHYDGAPPTTTTGSASAGNAGNAGGTGRGSGWAQGGVHAGIMPAAVPTTAVVVGTPATDAGLVTIFIRIAQSLASRTGLSADVSWRNAFGEVPSAVVSTPAGFFDDGVYDDPYASDSREAQLSLKSIVWRDVEMGALVSWQDKQYGATPAFDVDGNLVDGALRHDRVVRAGARVTWPLAPTSGGPFEMSVLCAYDFTRDHSTTAVYNYTSHAVGIGFQVAY